MQQKKKIRFILNPVSGNKNKKKITELIENKIDTNKYEYDIAHTQYSKHATKIALNAVENNYDIVVAIGGDGTVNEVSRALINTNTLFAIIPFGSGNGLSRFLKIPMRPEKALQIINTPNVFKMDALQINDEYFVNMAGVGFDAHISHLFASYGKRGFRSYLKLIIKEFFNYEHTTYKLKTESQTIDIQAFLISFANSSQFGNEAHIAPLAEINDGIVDICILKKFPWWKALFIVILLYSKRLTKSKYYNVIKAKEVEIVHPEELNAHIDGDPITFRSGIKINLIPQSLNIIIP